MLIVHLALRALLELSRLGWAHSDRFRASRHCGDDPSRRLDAGAGHEWRRMARVRDAWGRGQMRELGTYREAQFRRVWP